VYYQSKNVVALFVLEQHHFGLKTKKFLTLFSTTKSSLKLDSMEGFYFPSLKKKYEGKKFLTLFSTTKSSLKLDSMEGFCFPSLKKKYEGKK